MPGYVFAMSDTVQSIINAAADEADSLLDGVASPTEAKPLILDWLVDAYPELSQEQRHSVVRGIISILNREGFFEPPARSDSWSSDSDDEADE